MKHKINLTENLGIIVLHLTLGCNARCEHCTVESSPEKLGVTLTPDEVIVAIHTAKQNGIVAMELSGGEPFLVLDLVELSLKEATQAGLYPFIATNAAWAKTPKITHKILAHLAKLGLHHIQVSYDRYHAKFIQPGCVVNACEQAEQLGYKVQISITEANSPVKQRTLRTLNSVQRFILEEGIYLHNLHPPVRVGRGVNLSQDELEMDSLIILECSHFEHHFPLVSVFPSHLVSFCCGCANPRLTYTYPFKENWLADMLDVWNKDRCVNAMWHQGLAEISPFYKLTAQQPCGYCFELLPELFPDKELIDIRDLRKTS